MAEGNQDSQELVQSEAPKLDDFEENKKDSVDCFLGPDAQENAGGEGENAIATELNANNLAVRLAKAKKNRRNRKRRNKNRGPTESGLASNNESNDALVDTDTEDTNVQIVIASTPDSSIVDQNDNFEIKQIVVGSSLNSAIECMPEEDEDSFHSGLENQSSTTEQNNNTELNNEESDPIVNSTSVADREDSKLYATPSNDFAQENAVEVNHVVVDVSSNVLKENFVDCESLVDQSVLLQGQISFPDQDINEICSDEYESCANSSSVNIIYQSEEVTITEIENAQSEDTVLSSINEEDIEAMDKLNREWDALVTQDDCLDNKIWLDIEKSGNNFVDQELISEISTCINEHSDLYSPSSSSHIHLKVPNPSIEHLEGEELNANSIHRSPSGATSLFRSESDHISSVAPFNTNVNEILQQACIKVEQEIKSDPIKWGGETASVPLLTSTEDLAVQNEFNWEEMKTQEAIIDYHQTKDDEQEGDETFYSFNDGYKNEEVGMGINDFVIDMENEDFGVKGKAVNVSSVDISSEDDFIQKLINGNSSNNLLERTSQNEITSDLPNSLSDLNNGQCVLYPNTPSVNILYQSEDIILQETEAVRSEAAVHFYVKHPEVENVVKSKSVVFASSEDRLNNNYWPQDTKSEINLHDENEILDQVKVAPRVSIEMEEILPIASPKVEQELQSKSNLNVWDVDSSVVLRALNEVKAENREEDKESKKWSWKNLLPCMSNSPRSKSKDRNRSQSANKLDEEAKRKKRGSSLPRFLDRKRNEKPAAQVADETPKSTDPPR